MLQDQMRGVSTRPFFLKDGSTLVKISPKEILYVEAFDNYAYIHKTDKKILVPHTLKSVEVKLKSEHFVRAHKSYLVNLDHISSIDRSHLYIGKHKLRVGKVFRQQLLDLIQVI